MAKKTQVVKAKKPVSKKGSNKVIKKHVSKTTKHKVDQMNKQVLLDVSEINDAIFNKEEKTGLTLESLKEDGQTDKVTKKHKEEQKKLVNDDMLKQLEMISGFNL